LPSSSEEDARIFCWAPQQSYFQNMVCGAQQIMFPFAFCSPEKGNRINYRNIVVIISSDARECKKERIVSNK
jgi:hypothetical protein